MSQNGGGLWVHDPETDDWHLVVGQTEAGENSSWCRRKFPTDADYKSGDRINGLIDAQHDECLRKAQET